MMSCSSGIWEELSAEEIRKGLLQGIAKAEVFPVLCGSAYKNIAVQPLPGAIVDYLPAASLQWPRAIILLAGTR